MKKLLLILFTCKALFAWTPEVYDAVIAMEYGQPSKKQQGLILKHKAEINEMRMKGVISNKGYQSAQNFYDKVSIEIAKDAARVNGASMDVQTRTSKVFDAGTDSDFITNATSKEQVRGMQKSFNEKFEAKINSLGVKTKPNTKWHVVNDVDFMVDPENVSQKVFEEIAKENNDAYKRKFAAQYEKKVRSGQKVNLDEIMAYNEEMRDFVEKKRIQAKQISNELQKLEQNPNSHKKGTKEYIKKQRLEADLHLKNAHEAKYYTRMIHANDELASILDVGDPSVSSLPKEGKLRSNTLELSPKDRELKAKKQKIKSSLVNASHKHLMSQQKMNEAVLLSIHKEQFPKDKKMLDRYDKMIKKLTADFSPSQMGEFMEKTKPQKTYKKTDFLKPNVTQVQKPKLDVGIFDAISIYNSLEKAQNGEHLLVNFYKSDSSMQKLAKTVGVSLVELSPIPVVDAIQNSYNAEDRVKRGIMQDIAEGKDVSPALALAEVYADTAVTTFGNMFIKPSLDLVTESVDLGTSYLDNWEKSYELESDQAKNEKRKEAYEQRAKSVVIGKFTFQGFRKVNSKSFYILDDVRYGDKLHFYLNKSDTWLPEYRAKWEIWKGSQKITTLLDSPATNKEVTTVRFVNSLPIGTYQLYFRIFDANGKQINYNSTEFSVVKSNFDMSDIKVSGSKNYKNIKKNEKLTFYINSEGGWDSSYTIEWFIGGSKLKSTLADKVNANKISYTFDDYIKYGKHKITVRAIENKSGKILTSRVLQVNYPKPNQKREEKSQDEDILVQTDNSSLKKFRELMKEEENIYRQTTPNGDFNYLDELFGTVDDMVDWANNQESIIQDAYRRIERSRERMREIDRENAEFWKDFASVMQTTASTVQKYQKQKYAQKRKSYTSKSSSKKQYSLNSSDLGKGLLQSPLDTTTKSTSSSSAYKSCFFTVVLTASNRPDDYGPPDSDACNYPQDNAVKVVACGKTYYAYRVYISHEKFPYTLKGWIDDQSEDYYLDLESFGNTNAPLYDGIKILDENKKTICTERKY